MDAIKLLGDLLGNQSLARGGTAQSILKMILAGGGLPETAGPTGSAPAPQTRPTQPHARQALSREVGPMTDWDAPARSPAEIMCRGGAGAQGALGGLIRQAVGGYGDQHAPHQPRPTTRSGAARETSDPQSNSQAEVLIRAMINAAKSDGRLDDQEQRNIISKLGQLSQDEVDFLRHEFAQPLDLRQFARQVPRGLEVPVYTMSLTAIDLDTNREAQYLDQLAQAIGLPPETCNQIHAQLGAPPLYR